MAITVNDALCKRENGKLHVCVDGPDPEAVNNQEAKRVAIEHAAKCGYGNVGYNGTAGAVPVDSDGTECDSDERLTSLNKRLASGETKIAGYRNYIILVSR